jgi:N-acetyl sugar amidotransferase
MREYQICTRCIMDTTDPDIVFDERGECNHCQRFDNFISKIWPKGENATSKLDAMISTLKKEGKGKKYDCIIGLSGGIDSSYLALKVKEWGLRPLAVHVDGGWNSELASQNIEAVAKELDIDLFTDVINWPEMKDLQRSFLKSQVANQDVPQDHAFFAGLYRFATENNIHSVLSGSNFATESILPPICGYNAMDLRQLKSIHKKFGSRKLKTYPFVPFWKYYFYYPFIKKMRVFKPLNLIEYNSDEAIKELEEKLSWKYYGGKHHESRFTKYFQSYYLIKKFGFDKRRSHFSSMILSGQMKREDALTEMDRDFYPDSQIKKDQAYLAKKLKFTEDEFQELLDAPQKTHEDYANNEWLFKLKVFVHNLFKNMTRS